LSRRSHRYHIARVQRDIERRPRLHRLDHGGCDVDRIAGIVETVGCSGAERSHGGRRGIRRISHVDHCHGYGLGDRGGSAIRYRDGDVVNVVAIGITGSFEIGRGGKRQRAGDRIDSEQGAIATGNDAESQRLTFHLGSVDGHDGGGVFSQAGSGARYKQGRAVDDRIDAGCLNGRKGTGPARGQRRSFDYSRCRSRNSRYRATWHTGYGCNITRVGQVNGARIDRSGKAFNDCGVGGAAIHGKLQQRDDLRRRFLCGHGCRIGGGLRPRVIGVKVYGRQTQIRDDICFGGCWGDAALDHFLQQGSQRVDYGRAGRRLEYDIVGKAGVDVGAADCHERTDQGGVAGKCTGGIRDQSGIFTGIGNAVVVYVDKNLGA
jgi:hypothetical protein